MKSHQDFCAKEKLNFSLLADTARTMSTAYGTLNKPGGYSQRVTFVIDPKGIVRKIDPNVNAVSAGPDALALLRQAEGTAGRKGSHAS